MDASTGVMILSAPTVEWPGVRPREWVFLISAITPDHHTTTVVKISCDPTNVPIVERCNASPSRELIPER